MTRQATRVSLRARSVSWPEGRSSPEITLPAEQCFAEGLSHRDTIPAEYDREEGVVVLYVRDAEPRGGDDE